LRAVDGQGHGANGLWWEAERRKAQD